MPDPATSAPLEALLASIRKRCKSGLWSQGVTLARAGGVTVESTSAEEIVLRVRSPGRVVAPTVVLYPTENESECDCPARVSPCEHVAAAAIDLSTPKEEGAAAPAERAVARVGYRFTRGEGGLRLARVLIEADGSEAPLAGSLASRIANPTLAAQLQVDELDLRTETLLDSGGGAANRGVLAPTKLEALMRILTGAARVQLDGVPVAISEEEILPVATLTDATGPAASRRRCTSPSRPTRACAPWWPRAWCCARTTGADCCTAWARPSSAVSGCRTSRCGGRFAPAEMAELVTVVLPDLARRAAVDVRSTRLPPVVRDLAPRIVLELDQIDTGLSVLPTLVYGSPPVARIDDGQAGLPARPGAAARRAGRAARSSQRLRDELDLVPGRRTTTTAPDAPRFVDKLGRWRGDLAGDAAGIVKPNGDARAPAARHQRRRAGTGVASASS